MVHIEIEYELEYLVGHLPNCLCISPFLLIVRIILLVLCILLIIIQISNLNEGLKMMVVPKDDMLLPFEMDNVKPFVIRYYDSE